MEKKIDFLIIGSGIAGLSYALKVADSGSVQIITKGDEDESNTKYAQGGIATVMNEFDSFEKHIQDTLACGDGLCNEDVVKMVIGESKERIEELIKWGTKFDKAASGNFDLGREGGHSENRILHHKDITGKEIERALLEKAHAHPNIEIATHQFAIDLITQHQQGKPVTHLTRNITCNGAYVLNEKTGEIYIINAKTTLMATGGAGNVYSTTTNPSIATGDGIAMVYRAKGKIENMEFIQFHPTSLYSPKSKYSFLISEAVRGAGAILKTVGGKEFMSKYDKRLSLAPRDIVARAIDNEMKINGDDFVYLDCTGISEKKLLEHFPNIYERCLKEGIDCRKDYIPVVPAAHYLCGGIKVDMDGRTNIRGLYAVGECSCTGLHGANRLASNSLLEASVYAHRASIDAILYAKTGSFQQNIPEWNDEGAESPEEMVLITQSLKEVQAIMTNYVGIVRSELRLQRAKARLDILYEETKELYGKTVISVKLCELRNLITIAYLIIKMAMLRKESKGLHYIN